MKKSSGFNLIWVIVIVVVVSCIASIATGVIMLNNSYASDSTGSKLAIERDADLQEFIEVYETLLNKYYDDIDKTAMLNAAKEAMLKFLGDKYTTYMNDEQYQEIIDELSGTYNGIGVTIEKNKIVNVTPGSPAEIAGLRVNDIIVNVDGNDVSDSNGSDIGTIIKGSSNKNVLIVVLRGEETLSFNVEKQELVLPSIDYKKIEGKDIGYLYIKNFSQNLSSQVEKALKELENSGINSLIVDVRDNVGGYLSSAEETSSLFLESGKVIYSLETNNNKWTYKDETKERRTYPIVVLINGNSASASEILAAALKESYGATLVGVKSFGKGKVQQVVSLHSGDSVKYTSAKWLTPSGVCVDGIGISPDYGVRYEINGSIDSQLKKAIELLQ